MDVVRGHPVAVEPGGWRARTALAVGAVWAVGAGCLAAAGLLQGRLADVGRADLAFALPVVAVYVVVAHHMIPILASDSAVSPARRASVVAPSGSAWRPRYRH